MNNDTDTCKHCRRDVYLDRRGLCNGCYRNKVIREQYPSLCNARENTKTVVHNNNLVPCARPTDALPGTEEKILVMRDRFRRGEQIHHPEDAQYEMSPSEEGVS